LHNIKSKKAIIWDWNGTLLNDIVICVDCMNILLQRRKLPVLSIERYREIFTFPVMEYYKLAGFDFSNEPFETPAIEFIELYQENLHKAGLFPDVINTLKIFKNENYRQTILSAMEHESLIRSLKDNKILDFFDEISGIDNHYAHSKLEIGKDLVTRIGLPARDLLLIGDSLHDLEVAEELGVDCLLIANGHQSKKRLLEKSPFVLDNLNELSGLIN